MIKVVIDMTMSLDGFVAGPGDGKDFPTTIGLNQVVHFRDFALSSSNQFPMARR
jgi:hypothetical protein